MVEQYQEQYMLDLLQDLRTSKLYTVLHNAAQTEAAKASLRISDLKKGVQAGLVQSGWDRRLRNAVCKYIQTHPKASQPHTLLPEQTKEPLAHLRKAQQAWEKKILKSLNSMCT